MKRLAELLYHHLPRRIHAFLITMVAVLVLAGCSLDIGSLETGDDSEVAEGSPTPAAEQMDTDADDQVVVDDSVVPEPAQPEDADERSPVELAVERVKPAVVFLAVRAERPTAFGAPEEQEGVGSGVIFSEEGYVLTNNHVIEDATNISVVLPDGRRFEGTVLGRSPERDLAVVRIETDEVLPLAELGNSENVRVGQTVIAIGNALGLPGGPTVTTGVISALGRTIAAPGQQPMEDLVQTDAAINPGNSGGPLINLEGEVVGINTARIQGAEGIGFAVSIDTARRFISQVVDREPQPFIGITGLDLSPAIAEQYALAADRGILIVEVSPNTPATEAGLQPGDILQTLDGVELETVQGLLQLLEDYQPGDEVTLIILRNGEQLEVSLTLGESQIVR
jgi:serine protease Do